MNSFVIHRKKEEVNLCLMIDKEYLRNVSTINFENDSSYDKLLDALSGGKQVGHFQ